MKLDRLVDVADVRIVISRVCLPAEREGETKKGTCRRRLGDTGLAIVVFEVPSMLKRTAVLAKFPLSKPPFVPKTDIDDPLDVDKFRTLA